MSMTETFKGLPQPDTAAALVDHGKLIQGLRSANMQAVTDLTERLGPLGCSMALLTEAVTRSMLELKTFTDRAQDSIKGDAQRAKLATIELGETAKTITVKLWASMMAAALLVSMVAVSAFCAWQRVYSDDKAAAERWRTFESIVFPKLDKRTQETIRRTWQ